MARRLVHLNAQGDAVVRKLIRSAPIIGACVVSEKNVGAKNVEESEGEDDDDEEGEKSLDETPDENCLSYYGCDENDEIYGGSSMSLPGYLFD